MSSVGVIGAGVAGLVAAKTLLEEGFEVKVLEKESELGGVWAKSRRYPGLSTQNTRDTYAFSDWPMPRHYEEWPSGEHVQAYLSSYAEHFGVARRIELDTQVKDVRRREGGGFTITSHRGGAEEKRDFDFLVLATGVYSVPHVPKLPGREAFEAAGGLVLHTTAFHDVAIAQGEIREKVMPDDGYFRLYRGLVHPDVPGLGFAGFLDSLYCPLVFEVGARWLALHFKGEVRLPPREETLARIDAHLESRKLHRPRGSSSGLCVSPHNFHYIDELLRDMGARTRRRPKNPIREYLMPVDPSLYADLKAELDQNRAAR